MFLPTHTPHSSARGRGLTFQLFVFIVLPLAVLLVAITLGSLALHGRAMRELVGERDEGTVRAAAAATGEQLDHRAAAVRTIALQAAATESPADLIPSYAFLLPDFEGGLALISPEGQVMAASNSAADWQNRPTAALVARLDHQGEALFSEAFADSATGQTLMLVGSQAAGGPAAVGALAPASLARHALANAFSARQQSFAWMIDGQGQVLYQEGILPSETDLTSHVGVAEALQGQSGTTFLMVAGSEHVVAFSPISPVGWALLIEEPWEAVDNPFLRQTLAAPLLLIPVLLSALIALGFGIRQIVQPLRLLEERASQLAWGRFDPIEIPAGGIAEIRHLQEQLILMARKVRAAQQSLRGYLGAVTAGQEDERRRLARELHDGAVQSLVALDQQAQLAQLAAKKNTGEIPERLTEFRRMTTSLIEEVRRVVRALRPIYLEDLGLLPALEMLARDLEQTARVQVNFQTRGAALRLSPEREITVYRFAQEALSNVARHAQAKSVQISALFGDHDFALQVQDDGKGFAVPERVSDMVAAGHYGLMGMQERAELVGGRLDIQSAPGTGTAVELRVPL